MIGKKRCTLFDYSIEKGIRLTIYIFYMGAIKTYWCKRHTKHAKEFCKLRYCKYKNILHNLKLNGCAICGYNKCDGALDFHHVNEKDRKFSICACKFYHSNEKISEEISKCILLCKNCHYEIHTELLQ
jgi:hypothetical protein